MKTNNNIPAYRFQGYTDAWELRKLNNIADVRDGTHNSPRYIEFGYPLVTSKNIKNGQVNFEDIQYISSFDYEEINKRSKVNINDILMGMIGTVGNLALVREEPKFAIKNVALIKNIGVVNVEFLYHYLGSYVIERQLQNSLDGGTQKFISLNKIRHLDITFPSLPEQEAIGTFFSTLDRHITLHQRKLDTLKEQKKAYLKLLFPAKGQTKPALRFQGFEDDWEEVKLGELCDIRTGKLDANAMVENGEYDFYTSGIKKYRIDVAEFEGPAITIAGNGATVGYMHLADGKFNAYQRTYVLTNFKVDRSYIFSEIAKKLPIKIQQEARTGNIPYIVLSMLTELSISIPTLPEQEAIGTFFQNLDQEIAQVEDKLASLKEMKKTLLRKLFV
ncbi:restriction endonuclease subunit S [Streptococcus suis]|uniref:restriction endonuclease subunit S n=1 Tax=Streptococcus suis TaxID=1307 RepID=UPI0038B95224